MNFPDEMSQDAIKMALDKKFQSSDAPEQAAPASSFTDLSAGQAPQFLQPRMPQARLPGQQAGVTPTGMPEEQPYQPHGEQPGYRPIHDPEEFKQEAFRPVVPLPKFDVKEASALGGEEKTPQWEQALFNIVPGMGALHKASPATARSIANQIISGAEFVESPGGALATLAGPLFPVTVGAAFTADMLHGFYEQMKVTSQDWKKMTTGQRIDALVTMGAQFAMAGMAGFHTLTGVHANLNRFEKSLRKGKELPDASKVAEAAKVHGAVPAPPRQGAGQVPVQEGGEGVQPQPGQVAQEAQIPLEQKAAKPGTVSVPIIITKDMEAQLLKLGYTQDTINKLTPMDAWRLINEETLGEPKTEAQQKVEAGAAMPEGARTEPMGTMAAEDLLLTPFDAAMPRDQALPMIQNVYRVTAEQAWAIYERSRRYHKLEEPQESKAQMKLPGMPEPPVKTIPKTPPPLPTKKGLQPTSAQAELGIKEEEPPGVVQVSPDITKNPSGTFTARYLENGIAKKVPFKTLAEAEAWMKGKQGVPAKPQKGNRGLQYAIERAKASGSQVEFLTDEGTAEVDEPFVRGGFAYGRNGVITILESGFHEWLGSIPENRRVRAIDKLIEEESIHAFTTDMEAKRFYESMTDLERWLVNYRYSGEFSRERSGMTDTQIGHEAIRGAIQRLQKVPMSEAVVLGRSGRITARMIGLLEDWIRGVRTRLGTNASAWQNKILNDVQAKLELAKKGAAENVPRGTIQEPPPMMHNRSLREARDRGDLENRGTQWAWDAGLAMRTVQDLDDAVALHDKVKAEYDETLKEPPKVEGETTEQQMDRLQKRLRLAFQSQMIREAVEAATKSGSAADFELGDRPLDQNLKPEVRRWLADNASKLGIPTGEAPGFPERKKLVRPRMGRMPEMPRDLESLIVDSHERDHLRAVGKERYEKSRAEVGAMGYEPNIGTAIDYLVTRDPSTWPMRPLERARVLEWMNANEKHGWGRANLLLERTNLMEHYILDEQRKLEDVETTLSQLEQWKNTGDPGVWSMWKSQTVAERDKLMRQNQSVLDEITRNRQMLKDMTGDFYPEFYPEDRTLPPTGFEQPPPKDHPEFPGLDEPPPQFPERKKKVKRPDEYPEPTMDRDVVAAVKEAFQKFTQTPDYGPEHYAVDSYPAEAAALTAIPPERWDVTPEQRKTILDWMERNEGVGFSRLSQMVLHVEDFENQLDITRRQLGHNKQYLADLKREGKEQDTWPAMERTNQMLENEIMRKDIILGGLYNMIQQETGLPRKQMPEWELKAEVDQQAFPMFPRRERKDKHRWKMGKYTPAAQQAFELKADLPETERPRQTKAGETMPELMGEGQAAMKKVQLAELKSKLPNLPQGIEMTEDDILGVMQSYLSSKIEPGERPEFGVIAEWARRRLGINPDTIRIPWEDQVWKSLLRAKGDRLEELVHALNLETKLAKYVPGGGKPRLRNIAGIFEEAQLAEEAESKAREAFLEKSTRLEKDAAKLEQQADTLTEALKTRKFADMFQKMEAETEPASLRAKAKKKRDEATELVRMVREREVTLPEAETPKVKDKAAQAEKLRRRAKSLKEFADSLPGDSKFIKQYYTEIDGLNARAALLEKGESVETAEPVKSRTKQEQAAIKAQQFRSKAISEIALKMIGEATPQASTLGRKTIEMEDIDFTNITDAGEDPWHEISPNDRRNPRTMQSLFKSGARTSSKAPVTETRRLAVLRETKTGRVFVVSAYPEGREGVKMMHPYGSEHVPMDKLMQEYDPIVSILLKKPVKNFKWRFEDMAEFNDKLGTAGHEKWSEAQYYDFAGENALEVVSQEEQPDIEGTEGIEPAGVAGAGPGGKLMRAMTGEGRGGIEGTRKAPLTGNELGSVIDYIETEIGTDPTKSEISDAINKNLVFRAKELKQARRVMKRKKGVLTAEALERRGEWRPLTGEHRNVISAITKIATQIYHERGGETETSRIEAYEEALNHIYETFNQSHATQGLPQGAEGPFVEPKAYFTKKLLGRFTRPARKELPTTVKLGYRIQRELLPRTEGVERELSMRDPGLRKPPPTTGLKPGEVSPVGPPTGKLSPEEQAFVEQRAAQQIKYEPTPIQFDEHVSAYVEHVDRQASVSDPKRQPPELPPVPESLEPPPMMLNRAQLKAEAAYDTTIRGIRAGFIRLGVKDIITAGRDTVDNMSNRDSRMSANSVRIWSQNQKVRTAAIAALASRGDLRKAASFLMMCDKAITEASRDMRSPVRRDRLVAQERFTAATRLREAVEYYLKDPGSREIWNTAVATQRELKAAYDRETKHGINLQWEPDYVPGRYEGEIFNDDVVMFWEQNILGMNFRKPKMFANYFEAIAAGPYIPRSFDVAELVEHRVRQGMTSVNLDLYIRSLRDLIDKVSGEPVALDALRQKIWVPPNPSLGTPGHYKLGKYISPGTQYRSIDLGINKVPIYVRQGYESLVDMLILKEGGISKSPVGKFALQLNGAIKHSVILMLDTFHPFRLGQMAAASMGFKYDWKGPLSALEFRQQDMAQAVRAGMITQKMADWAMKPVVIKGPAGQTQVVARRDILDLAIQHGLNVGRLQDALYRQWIEHADFTVGGKKYGLGSINRWVFDKFTRGLMAHNVVEAFEEANNKYPNIDSTKLMRDVVKDINIYFGSLGRQGILKNPTAREISQLLFLAPQWVEGLIQKELRFYGRLSGISYLAGRRGLPPMGTLGKAVGRGLMGYFVLTQAINLLSRRQFTWQNEEEGHKMDAWIPTGDGKGLWLSPMSVFAEVTHDVIRMWENRATPFHAIRQIGENKLGPLGRFLFVLATLEGPRGERPQTSRGVAGMVGEAVAPVPISVGKFARAGLHAAFPGTFAANPPGTLPRQAFAMAGIKTEQSRAAASQMYKKARDWKTENKLNYRPYVENPTEEASYEKLLVALRNNDPGSAQKVMDRLREFKNDKQILDSMRRRARRGFTGNKKYERWFIATLSPEEGNLYSQAVVEKYQDLERFIQFYVTEGAK